MGYFYVVQPVYEAIDYPNNMYVTTQDINYANTSSQFAPFLKFNLADAMAVNGEEITSTTMRIKLFGFLPLKKVKVKLINSPEIYVGGNIVGFSLNTEGVMIVGSNAVFTKEGSKEPIIASGLQEGDSIKAIEGKEISSIYDIDKIINNEKYAGKNIEISVLRNNEQFKCKITPALDIFTKKYKLGLWVKNSTSGVGTLTYVKKNNNRFGAVGHALVDANLGGNFKVSQGEVYLCNLLGIKKGSKNAPGELRSSMKLSDDSIGVADTNCKYGVYGNILNVNKLNLIDDYVLGGRMSIKPGNAKIYACLDDEGVKGYDIKIIKTNHQDSADEKSIVFKVTDKLLIEKTGGIIQGMSGCPIIQNDKLVGAVTHVFVNDPTKGFGVYVDWMYDN
jgi:stage IV sporulation protein B